MTIYLDQVISGNGSDNLVGGIRVEYAFIDITTIGPVAKLVDTESDHYLRLGWIAFGTHITVPDLGEFVYWREPIWFNFARDLWSPVPQVEGSGANHAIYATIVRWHLTFGTEGRLIVSGV